MVMGWFKHSLFAVGAVLALTGPAAAIPVTWQLQNAVFASGRTATGSFVYDADTNTYSNIDIDTMSSPTNHYDTAIPLSTSGLVGFVTGVLADYVGTPALAIAWATPLTNAGGTVPFDLAIVAVEGTCITADCLIIISVGPQQFVSGEVVAAVAEPASLTLLAVGLFGMVVGRRRLRTPAMTG
jgi:hypothetical protein